MWTIFELTHNWTLASESAWFSFLCHMLWLQLRQSTDRRENEIWSAVRKSCLMLHILSSHLKWLICSWLYLCGVEVLYSHLIIRTSYVFTYNNWFTFQISFFYLWLINIFGLNLAKSLALMYSYSLVQW